MHVQPISTFRLFQEGHLLRNSIAIFVLTTLFYFIGAELRLVHELSLFWPLNGVMAGVFARYVWLNRLHYYAISYVAMLVYDAIALNGMTKFRTRILPQLLAGQKANGTLPARLTFALAALIAFYRGVRNGETYPVQDDAHWLERYQQLWSQYRDRVIGTQELVAIVLAEKDHWEQDLTQVPGLVEQVANDLDAILEKGMREAVRPLC